VKKLQTICIWPSCDRLIQYKKARLCSAHYQRQRDGRDMGAPFRGGARICSWPGCDRPHQSKGLCARHYQRQIRGDDMDAPLGEQQTCSHPGCDRPHNARGYCSAHYARKFILHSDMDAPIRRRRRKGEPPLVCIVEDCDDLQKFASGMCPRHERRRKAGNPLHGPAYYHETRGWTDKNGYRKTRRNGKTVGEHRIIMEETLGRPLLRQEEVHHKNGIKADNSPGNLELWVSWKGQRVDDLIEFVAANYRDRMLARLACSS
jgi:hypothetical protein